MLFLGSSLVSELIAYSVIFYALVFLETNHNRGQLELLCIVSHIKLGPESTTLYLCMSFYVFVILCWGPGIDGP